MMDERKKNNLFYVVITIFNLGFATTTREGAVSSFHSCDSIHGSLFRLIDRIFVGGIVTHASRITCQHILVRLANSILGRWSLGRLGGYFVRAIVVKAAALSIGASCEEGECDHGRFHSVNLFIDLLVWDERKMRKKMCEKR